MNYKETLQLPTTVFPMKADLAELEQRWQSEWRNTRLYDRIRDKTRGGPRLILHDGPPYSNGDIHFGHLFNKTLKDIAVRSWTLMGHDAPFILGWDCHGLPIESAVGQLGDEPADIRKACCGYAKEQVARQRAQFERLGLLCSDTPYTTMDPNYEKGVLSVFSVLVDKDLVQRRLRPITWCAHDRTALADAEVEYRDVVSDSYYVEFPMLGTFPHTSLKYSMIAWTTTPWTLPANVALAVHPDVEYQLITLMTESGRPKNVVVAKDRVNEVLALRGYKPPGPDMPSVLAVARGSELAGATYHTAFGRRLAKVVAVNYVTATTGTGVVHTAPGHGIEDYRTASEFGLDILCPVDEFGNYLPGTHADLDGLNVLHKGTTSRLHALLSAKDVIWATEKYTHSYPHCWRCQRPTLTRATAQWFVKLDDGLRTKALEAIGITDWLPGGSINRIREMVANRPDWCISRQRRWGIPIPAMECIYCGEQVINEWTINLCMLHGSDWWFVDRGIYKADESIPLPICKCGSKEYRKAGDIFDVWFESGASFYNILNDRSPHDTVVYLEGNDQHRGWFQSSLLLGVGYNGLAPFDTVVTHGWVVDKMGKKFSKSKGAPPVMPLLETYGADVVRLYIAAQDFTDDLRVDEKSFADFVEVYRKIRNTFRFILGNLDDFQNGHSDLPPFLGGHKIDLYMLGRLNSLIRDVKECYEDLRFYQVYHQVVKFCIVDLSANYFDIIKDRLYCDDPHSPSAVAARWVLGRIYITLVRLLAPLIPHTAEELWRFYESDGSVFLEKFPEPNPAWDRTDTEWQIAWEKVFAYKALINTSIEALRSQKLLSVNEEARVQMYSLLPLDESIFVDQEYGAVLREVTRVAEIIWDPALEDGIKVSKSKDMKCERCRRHTGDVRKGLCVRCSQVSSVKSMSCKENQ